jgi:hypothetical protein
VLDQTPHSLFWDDDAVEHIAMSIATPPAIPAFDRHATLDSVSVFSSGKNVGPPLMSRPRSRPAAGAYPFERDSSRKETPHGEDDWTRIGARQSGADIQSRKIDVGRWLTGRAR